MQDEIRKLFETTFIGNLATIEREKGSLWGHGKRYSELTTSEKIWRKTWVRVRNQILDHSNLQLRKAYEKLS